MFDKKTQDRFWNKVEVKGKNECWNWTAYKNRDGYGNFALGVKKINAHKVSYIINYGSVQDGFCVCHTCDNPSCVNPNHLFLATHKENMLDKKIKGRARTKVLTNEQKDFISNSKLKPKVLAKIFGISGRGVASHRHHK